MTRPEKRGRGYYISRANARGVVGFCKLYNLLSKEGLVLWDARLGCAMDVPAPNQP